LIQEAGGKVSDLDGTPYKLETRNMLCSNGLVHDEVLNILREADAVSFTRSTE
jgi:myo-inositol-1(or 4)-monophosphatase